ncbi:MAG: inositol monophosphatase [Bacteroidia bacterium]|nr:inositol monophosphatase [Bacteroidia bacterium]
MENCEEILLQTKALVIEVGAYIRQESKVFDRSQTETKGLHDYVSYVDKTSEQKLVAGLEKIFPEAGFIAEENTSSRQGERYNWIIDPLDGTTNFIHGLPCFAISVALVEDQSPILGIIYEINLDECFYAAKGLGAWLNGKPIRVSEMSAMEESFLATGFPYKNYGRLNPYMDLMKYLLNHTRGIRRLGSAATDMAYVACGRFDAFYEYGLAPWDVAAGIILIQEAGGEVSDFKGGKDYLFGKEINASNGKIHRDLGEVIARFMNQSQD